MVERVKEGDVTRSHQIGVLCWLCIAFTFFSLDEAAEIHENLGGLSDSLLPGGTRENTVFAKTGIWMFVLFIPAAAFGLGFISFLRSYAAPRAYRTTILAGVLVFLGSALGVEILANWARQGAAEVLQVTCEEVGEMIGSSIILWATFDLLRLKLQVSGWPRILGPR